MQKISELSAGEFPYEEHVPTSTELWMLRQRSHEIYDQPIERFYVFQSFTIKQNIKISDHVMLAEFLALWLKKYMVPTQDDIAAIVILPIV